MNPNIIVCTDALILFEKIENESIDLVYLDPPWFSMNDYKGKKDKNSVEEEYNEFMYKVSQQAQRVLKSTGSLVLFTEPIVTMNLQESLTKVFGTENFVSEFIIPRHSLSSNRDFQHKHSRIIFFKKSDEHYFNSKVTMSDEVIKNLFPYSEDAGQYRLNSIFQRFERSERPSLYYEWRGITPPNGYIWRYHVNKLEELYSKGYIDIKREGRPSLKTYVGEDNITTNISSLWTDIDTKSKSYKNYPVSQSEELLERVIKIGSKVNQIILDPFCGSGTSLIVSSKLNRKWIGCDSSSQAIKVTEERLKLLNFSDYSIVSKNQLQELPTVWDNYEKLNATIEDKIIQMIAVGETDDVEFKESAAYNYRIGKVEKDSLTDNILQAIAAFSNSENGGILFIGVRNDKKLVNLADGDYAAVNKQKSDQDAYALYLNDKILTLLGVNVVSKCKITFYQINFCDICMIEIKPSSQLVFFRKVFYLRNGNRKAALKNEEFYDYLKSRFDINSRKY